MRIKPLIRICTSIIFLAVFCGGCIHTYPKGEPEDPSLITLTLSLTLGINFSNSSDGATEKVQMPRGIYQFRVLVLQNGRTIADEENFIRYDGDDSKPILLPISTPLQERNYHILVWSHLVDSENRNPLHYDVADLSSISVMSYWESIYATSAQLAFPICLRGEADFSPGTATPSPTSHDYTLPVSCSSPAALLRVEATDAERFISVFPTVTVNPGAFSIEISFTTPAPDAFNLLTGSPARYSSGWHTDTPLLLPDPSAFKVTEIPLFPDSSGEELTADITVYNSARSIISRTRGISFTLKPNHTTVVRGPFLSNFFQSPLHVENEWEGEIVIEYDGE